MKFTNTYQIEVEPVENQVQAMFDFLKSLKSPCKLVFAFKKSNIANTNLQGDFNDFKDTNYFALVQLFAQYVYAQQNRILIDTKYTHTKISEEFNITVAESLGSWYDKFLKNNILLQMGIKDNKLNLYLKDLNPLDDDMQNKGKIAKIIQDTVQFPPIALLQGSTTFNNVSWTEAEDKPINLQININLGGLALKDKDIQELVYNNFTNKYKFGTKITQKLLLNGLDYISVDIKARFKGDSSWLTLAIFLDNLADNFVVENINDIYVNVVARNV